MRVLNNRKTHSLFIAEFGVDWVYEEKLNTKLEKRINTKHCFFKNE